MEEIKFKNTSRMSGEEIAIFQSYAMKNTNILMSIFFTVIFVGLGVGLSFWNLTVGVILVVCGLAGGIFFLPYLLKENQKRNVLQELGDRKYLNTFEFYEEYLCVKSTATVSADSKDYQDAGSLRVEYSEVFKIATYKDRLFIFLNPQQSFIVNFNGMTMGTIAELIDFLKSKNIMFMDKSNIDTTKK
ncbi:MAG: YcxB family protein [Clostridiales bacterium]|nr:YcxB family protein [Clostridiales bacterium]